MLPGKVILIPDPADRPTEDLAELVKMVRQADRSLYLKNFCKHIDTKDESHAASHVRRAEKAGLMRKISWYGRWVEME